MRLNGQDLRNLYVCGLDQDQNWMFEALAEAKNGRDLGEVPIGAIVVVDGVCIARGCNMVEQVKDATCHAELLALKRAAAVLGRWRLQGATLYSTLEPCAMCAGAMISSRIDRLVWGAPDLRQGADGSFIELLGEKHPIHNFPITKGVLKEESAELLRDFFAQKRCLKKGLVL
ncbi:MAG: tRNA-specific adenosine deaminase [Chlamydiae bacterium]|nr:tRNA-specific adenosine deaminase [Chlamydiota bacterium]